MKKHFRSFFALLLSLALTASLFAGCTGGTGKDGSTSASEEQTTRRSRGSDEETEGTESASAETEEPSSSSVPGSQPGGDGSADEQLAALADEIFREYVTSNTLNLHYTLADPEAFGLDDYEITLGSWSPAEEEEEEAEEDEYLARLNAIDRTALSEEYGLLYDILKDAYDLDDEYSYLEYFDEPLTTTSGDHIELPILLAEYTFYTEKDAEDYLLLIEDIKRYFETIVEYEKAKYEAGMFMSDDMANEVIGQCQSFLDDPENNFLLITLPERLEAIGFDEAAQEEYIARAKETVDNYAIPAYQMLQEELGKLRDGDKNPATDSTGLPRFENGQDYYKYLLKSDVGTDKTPEELKSLLEENLTNYIYIIQRNYSDIFEDDAADLSDALSDPEEILKDLQEKALDEFPSVAGTKYAVKSVPTALEETTSPAFYLTPPFDRSDDNIIYINNKYTDLSSLYTTLAHEGYPGHLLQTVYFNRACSIPLRHLLSWGGYVEGWATYVEYQSYAWEDHFATKTQQVLMANDKATLVLYGLMDLGVNYEGWDESQLSDFLYDYFDVDDDTVHEIFLALIGQPANYLNYIVGCLEWEEMRAECEDTWVTFEPLAFHEKALRLGPAPFYILKEYMANP